jgi:hypothetical protein
VFLFYQKIYIICLQLNIWKFFNIDLLIADDSTKHPLGTTHDVMVELHMTFAPVDFVIMDMGGKSNHHIMLGRPFLRTTGEVIDSKEGNVKFQFPHKKFMENFLGRRMCHQNTSVHLITLKIETCMKRLDIWL